MRLKGYLRNLPKTLLSKPKITIKNDATIIRFIESVELKSLFQLNLFLIFLTQELTH